MYPPWLQMQLSAKKKFGTLRHGLKPLKEHSEFSTKYFMHLLSLGKAITRIWLPGGKDKIRQLHPPWLVYTFPFFQAIKAELTRKKWRPAWPAVEKVCQPKSRQNKQYCFTCLLPRLRKLNKGFIFPILISSLIIRECALVYLPSIFKYFIKFWKFHARLPQSATVGQTARPPIKYITIFTNQTRTCMASLKKFFSKPYICFATEGNYWQAQHSRFVLQLTRLKLCS